MTDCGFALQNVFVDRSLPLEIRYLAIIQLKNGIDKYWRKHALKYIICLASQLLRSDVLSVQYAKKIELPYGRGY
jgi:hypothetical protein